MRSLFLVLAVILSAASAAPQAAQQQPQPPQSAARASSAAPAQSSDPDVIACEAGDLDRCFPAVKVLQADATLAGDARTRWDAGCRRDDAKACFRLGLLLPLPDMLTPVTRACQLDLMEGCLFLAVLFESGESQNPRLGPAADDLYRKTCDRGLASGCLSLASRFDRPGASPADREQALALLDRACRMDERIGCERAHQLRCELGTASDCPAPGEGGPGGMLGGVLGDPSHAPPPPPPPPPGR
jgi:TPR repeat protein